MPLPDAPNYLDALATRDDQTRFWVLHQIDAQLARLRQQGETVDPAWEPWADLLRFCLGRQTIVAWLRDEPHTLQRIQALAALAGEHTLADMLSEALQGQAQPNELAIVTFSQPGEPDLHYSLGGSANEHYEGQDWAATDALLQLHLDGFAHTIAQLILAERDQLYLPPPTPGRLNGGFGMSL